LDARLVKHMVDLARDAGSMIEHIHPFKLSSEYRPIRSSFNKIPGKTSKPRSTSPGKKKLG
jgi:hypothetical protein